MSDLYVNPDRDLELELVAFGVVSNLSEAVGCRARLIDRGFSEDDILVFEDEEGARMLRPDGLEEDQQCHAEGHLMSGHRLIGVQAGDEDELRKALDDLNDLGVREADVGTEWVARRDSEFNQRVFNTGGVVAERSAQSDEEKESINSREGEEHQADHNPWPPSKLATKAAQQDREDAEDDDPGLLDRVLGSDDDDRGFVDRILGRDGGEGDPEDRDQDGSEVQSGAADASATEEDRFEDDPPAEDTWDDTGRPDSAQAGRPPEAD